MSEASRGQTWLHRCALLTAAATFPLLFVGGLVTSTGSALAVPDWPTTFGHNMFLYPWSQMVGGIFYEHSHRLLGALVGFLTMMLTGWLWLQDARPWVRWLGGIALGAVIVQGVLGGLRVVLLRETLAIVHACLAQAFFGLVVSIALFTSPGWQVTPPLRPTAAGRRLWRLCLLTTGLIYTQIILGAVVRHTGWRLDVHVLLAVVVSLHVLLLAAGVRRHHGDYAPFFRPALLLAGLIGLQLGLGLGAYLVKFTSAGYTLDASLRIGVTTAHLVVGALMFVTSLTLTLRIAAVASPLRPAMAGRVLAEQVSP